MMEASARRDTLSRDQRILGNAEYLTDPGNSGRSVVMSQEGLPRAVSGLSSQFGIGRQGMEQGRHTVRVAAVDLPATLKSLQYLAGCGTAGTDEQNRQTGGKK